MQERNSLYLPRFFYSASHVFLSPFAVFFSATYSPIFSSFMLSSFSLPLARSLEGFIYSPTHLYLGKIQ